MSHCSGWEERTRGAMCWAGSWHNVWAYQCDLGLVCGVCWTCGEQVPERCSDRESGARMSGTSASVVHPQAPRGWRAQSQTRRSLESNLSVRCSVSWFGSPQTERGSPRTRPWRRWRSCSSWIKPQQDRTGSRGEEQSELCADLHRRETHATKAVMPWDPYGCRVQSR